MTAAMKQVHAIRREDYFQIPPVQLRRSRWGQMSESVWRTTLFFPEAQGCGIHVRDARQGQGHFPSNFLARPGRICFFQMARGRIETSVLVSAVSD